MIEGDSIDGILYYDINILNLQIAQGDIPQLMCKLEVPYPGRSSNS